MLVLLHCKYTNEKIVKKSTYKMLRRNISIMRFAAWHNQHLTSLGFTYVPRAKAQADTSSLNSFLQCFLSKNHSRQIVEVAYKHPLVNCDWFHNILHQRQFQKSVPTFYNYDNVNVAILQYLEVPSIPDIKNGFF